MDHHWILSPPAYYARLNTYILDFGLPYSKEDFQNWEERTLALRTILGDGAGQSALDCSCGWGTQAVPLAKLGWQVTACDVSETSLVLAREYASQENVSVDFRICDMRDLSQVYRQHFVVWLVVKACTKYQQMRASAWLFVVCMTL